MRVGDSTRHAFLWQNGKMTDLGTPGGKSTNCHANAINSNGQVVGYCWSRVGGYGNAVAERDDDPPGKPR